MNVCREKDLRRILNKEDDMSKTSKTKTKKTIRKKESAGRSKGTIIVELLRRKEGATIAELTSATGWQSHSIRGFLSAQVTKKMGLKLQSTKREDGQRVYKIAS